jgi:hypothetical protein
MLVRKKTLTFFCMMVILAAYSDTSHGYSRVPPEPDAAPGKVLVSFHDGVENARIVEILRSVDGTVEKVLASTGVHIIILPGSAAVADAVHKLASYSEVRYAEPVERAQPLEEK